MDFIECNCGEAASQALQEYIILGYAYSKIKSDFFFWDPHVALIFLLGLPYGVFIPWVLLAQIHAGWALLLLLLGSEHCSSLLRFAPAREAECQARPKPARGCRGAEEVPGCD